MLIEISKLRLAIGDATLLQDVNLNLAEGEIYGLLGPNGAGKSTTIHAALGLLPFQSGKVRMLGRNVAEAPTRIYGEVGVLPEDNGFYPWMTAEEYLGFFARLYGLSPTPKEIAGHLAQVGLVPRRRQSIATYSRGMRQRLGLARALLPEPRLLILDEPTNGLDPRGRRDVHDVLLDLARNRKVGILLCTHLLDDVDRLCNRIGILSAGRTVAEGAIAELMRANSQASRFRLVVKGGGKPRAPMPDGITLIAADDLGLVVDLDPGLDPSAAWARLIAAGWPVAEIRRIGSGLEDLYLKLTDGAAAPLPETLEREEAA